MSAAEREIDDGDVALAPSRPELQPPPKYVVKLINDDYTPMDFVIIILMGIFNLPQEQAIDVTMKVHNEGEGIAGTYTREIAEAKIHQAEELARSHSHPLMLQMAKA